MRRRSIGTLVPLTVDTTESVENMCVRVLRGVTGSVASGIKPVVLTF